MAAGLDDLAQPGVDALDGVGGVDHLADRRREGKEGDHPIPGAAPSRRDGWEFLSPATLGKGIEFGQCGLGAGCRVDGLDRRRQRLAVFPTGVIQTVADQVHDAGLQRGRRKHRRQRLGHALQAIGDGDQDVGHAPGLQIVEDLHPELGAFGAFDPQPENVARAVRQDAQGQIDGLVAHHGVLANLDPQGVEEDHRIHRFERPPLPGRHLGHYGVGDRTDELGRHLGAVLFGEKPLDLAHRHAARVHGDDLVVEAGEASFVLRDQDRGEASVPVARDVDAQRPFLGQDGLAARPVAMVVGVGRLFGPRRVAQVVGELRPQGAFDQRLLESHRGGIDRLRRHRPAHQLLNDLFGNARQLHRRFLLARLAWHTCSFQAS